MKKPSSKGRLPTASGTRATLLLGRSSGRARGALVLFGFDAGPVVLDILLHIAVAPGGRKIVILHFRIDLIVIPVVMGEPINGAHNACAVLASSAVNKKLTSCRIVNELKKRGNLFSFRVVFVAHGDIDIAHTGSFGAGLFITDGIVAQINHGLNAQSGEIFQILLIRLGAAIKAIVHFAKVSNMDV